MLIFWEIWAQGRDDLLSCSVRVLMGSLPPALISRGLESVSWLADNGGHPSNFRSSAFPF